MRNRSPQQEQAMSIDRTDNVQRPKAAADLSRRNILLASTTIAASALAASGETASAQAQRPAPSPTPAPAGQRPNIVVIMGDDIGMWNIGAYHRGLMAG